MIEPRGTPVGPIVAVLLALRLVWHLAAIPLDLSAAQAVAGPSATPDAVIRAAWSLDRPLLPVATPSYRQRPDRTIRPTGHLTAQSDLPRRGDGRDRGAGFRAGARVRRRPCGRHRTRAHPGPLAHAVDDRQPDNPGACDRADGRRRARQYRADRVLPKALIAGWLSFFPITTAMVTGLRAPERMQLDLMRTYNASGSDVFAKLRWPASMGFLFAGVKVAATLALVGAIVAELPTGAQAGLGARLLAGSYYGQTLQIWAALVTAGLLTMLAVAGADAAQRVLIARRGGRLLDRRCWSAPSRGRRLLIALRARSAVPMALPRRCCSARAAVCWEVVCVGVRRAARAAAGADRDRAGLRGPSADVVGRFHANGHPRRAARICDRLRERLSRRHRAGRRRRSCAAG